MQEGAGVRQVIEEELRAAGLRLRDLDVRLELGLQESARSAVVAGYGVTFISRSAIEGGHCRRDRRHRALSKGSSPRARSRWSGRPVRAETRVAQAFVEFARARLA